MKVDGLRYNCFNHFFMGVPEPALKTKEKKNTTEI